MSALIASSAIRTCLGDGDSTFAALLRGDLGVSTLRWLDAGTPHVTRAYQIPVDGPEPLLRPSRWLADCVAEALAAADVDPVRTRVAAIVGTGLRELRVVERCALEPVDVATERLHFESAIREVCPAISRVITLSNACSAGGHALALAQDLLELDEADVVIAAAADALTESMLAMIGRFATGSIACVRPFDRDRTGVLLGEGAAAVVVVREDRPCQPRARLLSSGLSCDAVHETVPAAAGIRRAVDDAFARGGRTFDDVDLVLAHGTGTALNDPLEAELLEGMFGGRTEQPLITGIKGALGHTSGAAHLMSVDVAMRCLAGNVVPPIAGLDHRLEQGHSLALVVDAPVRRTLHLAQIDAFGFGGVNAITLLEAV